MAMQRRNGLEETLSTRGNSTAWDEAEVGAEEGAEVGGIGQKFAAGRSTIRSP